MQEAATQDVVVVHAKTRGQPRQERVLVASAQPLLDRALPKPRSDGASAVGRQRD
jgi:hypothetical protein